MIDLGACEHLFCISCKGSISSFTDEARYIFCCSCEVGAYLGGYNLRQSWNCCMALCGTGQPFFSDELNTQLRSTTKSYLLKIGAKVESSDQTWAWWVDLGDYERKRVSGQQLEVHMNNKMCDMQLANLNISCKVGTLSDMPFFSDELSMLPRTWIVPL